MINKLKRPIFKELDLPQYKRDDLKEACNFLDSLKYAIVKTKYNKKGQWDAVSLRGYSEDPLNVLKPGVLKSDIEPAELRDTHLVHEPKLLPLIEMLSHIPAKFERVRVMRLKAGTSISKHTDKVDKSIGFEDGEIVRIHIPLRTSDRIHFYLWKDKKSYCWNLEQGKYYYTDVTRPHAVHNKAIFDRLHLVVDCYSNAKIRALILQEDDSIVTYDEDNRNTVNDPFKGTSIEGKD